MKQSETKVSPSEVKKYLDEGYKLVDIREKSELVDTPLFKDSINIPMSALLADPRQFLTDLSEKIILVCRSGKRSKVLKEKMYTLGYTDVLDVAGGITALIK